MKLRKLEKSLLHELNSVKGKILDDDTIITKLETLKKDAEDISNKRHESDKVIAEFDMVSQQYMPLAQVKKIQICPG